MAICQGFHFRISHVLFRSSEEAKEDGGKGGKERREGPTSLDFFTFSDHSEDVSRANCVSR